MTRGEVGRDDEIRGDVATGGDAADGGGAGTVGAPWPLPARVVRYGVDAPLPARQRLRAGPLSAVLEAGALRYVSVGGREVVRGVYAAVRDQHWGTVPAHLTAYEVEDRGASFAVRFTAEHVADEIDFAWEGRIEGTEAGVITFAFDGAARRPFLRNRIGFCVLHPMAMAGQPVTLETGRGTESGSFPERISPHQPFFDLVAIRHGVGGGSAAELEVRFTGDLFETEDQRNWTDASYKTYCTPLRLPMPVEVQAGAPIRQTVTLSVAGTIAPGPDRLASGDPTVRIGAEPIGALPPIGLGMATHRESFADVGGSRERALSLARLRALHLAHLRVDLDLTADGWEARLARGVAEARALDGPALELEVVAGDGGEGLERLIPRLKGGPAVAGLLVFPRSGMVSTEAPLARARALAAEAGLGIPIGGGSRAHFTELNRAALPLELMDVVGYGITPQVHAFDNASLVETLAAQSVTVASARAIAGDRPLAVGPVTLRPRFNAVAGQPEPGPRPDALPWSVDPRQLSLFGAGWTVGSLRRLAEAGSATLTYYETTGWRGVMERHGTLTRQAHVPSRPGMPFPLSWVFEAVGQFAGASLLPVEVSDPLTVEALALRSPHGSPRGDRLRVLVASFVDAPRTVRLTLPVGPETREATVRSLDETNAEHAMASGSVHTPLAEAPIAVEDGVVELTLGPFAVARVDANPSG